MNKHLLPRMVAAGASVAFAVLVIGSQLALADHYASKGDAVLAALSAPTVAQGSRAASASATTTMAAAKVPHGVEAATLASLP